MKQNLTYIIESQGYYKIGKTKDLETRLKVFDTHCFKFAVVKLIYSDIEDVLHEVFKHKRIKLEWFALDKEDLDSIDQIVLDYQTHCENYADWTSKGMQSKGKKIFGESARINMSIAAKKRSSNQDKKVVQKSLSGEVLAEFSSIFNAGKSQGRTKKLSFKQLQTYYPEFIWEVI